MIEHFASTLAGYNKEIAVVLIAALPVGELRLAMPLAIALGFSPQKAFWLSLAGNMLPVVPLLFFLEPVSNRLRHIKIFARFFDWFFARTMAKGGVIEKYESVGLAIFVGIPLPGTGAWTGCVAASLFKIRFRYAFLAVTAGVVMAGLIVLALCMAGKLVFNV